MSYSAVLEAEHRLLASVRSRAEIYERTHDAARRLMPVDAFYVCLYEPKNRQLAFEYNGDDERLDTPERFALGTGPTSRAILAGKPHVLNHLNDAEIAPYAFGDTGRRSRGAIHLPFWDGTPGVRGNGAPLGVLSVQSYTHESYDRSQVAAVRWLAARTLNLLRETEAQVAQEAAQLAAESERRKVLRSRIESLLHAHGASVDLREALEEAFIAFEEPGETLDTRTLTDREIQSLTLAAQGLSYGRIADVLGIGRETVKTHLPRAYAKVGLADGRALARHLPTLLSALAARRI